MVLQPQLQLHPPQLYALSDSPAFYSSLPFQYWESLNMLFNQSDYWRAKGGAALNLVRSPLGSCDFSIAEYSFDET